MLHQIKARQLDSKRIMCVIGVVSQPETSLSDNAANPILFPQIRQDDIVPSYEDTDEHGHDERGNPEQPPRLSILAYDGVKAREEAQLDRV